MPSLKIGSEQNAILLIQQTQTDPQKAVAELVENSIDAKARRVRITRARRDGMLCLIVSDDGEGVRAGADGAPDMEYVATHVCDSLKQKLDPKHRQSVQGQFGIGLLGFAAVGQELTLRSKRPGSVTRSIRLHAFKSDYELGTLSKGLRASGTEAEIRGVRREIQNRLTAEKLHRYLSEELRDRIKSSGVRIVIEDNVGVKKTLVVTPREYSGIPLISGQKEIATTLGPMKLDLYFSSAKDGDRAVVSISRRGTRLLSDLLECDELRHEPWSLGVIEGVIEFAALSPAPATRHGFLPDSAYEEFVARLESLEPGLKMEVEARRKQQDERLSKEMLERLQRAFAEAMQELSEDYSWFEKGGSDIRAEGRPKGAPGGRPKPVLLSKGPLSEVRIRPKIAVIGPDEARALTARCLDPHGALIPTGISYSWWTASTLLSLKPNGQVATIEACGKEGEALVRVTARLAGAEKQAESRIVIAKAPNQFRFPPLEFVAAPTESWRSQYADDLGVLKINSGHRDYERAKAAGAKPQMRYVATLYAKELVLFNFGNVPASRLLESMVELTTVLESKL